MPCMDATQVIEHNRMTLHRPVPVLKFLRAYPYRTMAAALAAQAGKSVAGLAVA